MLFVVRISAVTRMDVDVLVEQAEAFGTTAPGLREGPQLYSDPLVAGHSALCGPGCLFKHFTHYFLVLLDSYVVGLSGTQSPSTQTLWAPSVFWVNRAIIAHVIRGGHEIRQAS